MSIYKEGNNIIFEDSFSKITLSKKDAKVKSIIDKTVQKEIRGAETHFFYLVAEDEKTFLLPSELSLEENIVTVRTKTGNFKIEVCDKEQYFTFELKTALPACYKAVIAHAKYDYDFNNKQNCAAAGIAMTYWANPCLYPDAANMETKAEVIQHLKDKDAKYALIIAPIAMHKEIIKEVSLTIDKNYGIVSRVGGAWGEDCKDNYRNKISVHELPYEKMLEQLEFYKTLNIGIVDFNQGCNFCQGDFEPVFYKNNTEFKEKAVAALEKENIIASLHTYSAYIDYNCNSILSNPKWQKQLATLETFTLSADIDENAQALPVMEPTDNVIDDVSGLKGFFTRSTPFLLVGEELIKFKNSENGFESIQRGACGTKASAHKKGEKVYHLDGYYRGILPALCSNLFFEIARNTAKAFNEGGYGAIYLDALDGLYHHIKREEGWFYFAAFVCEILKHCNKDPLIEYSTIEPSIWPARGNAKAFDFPTRGYKTFQKIHKNDNERFKKIYYATTSGWYNIYPYTETLYGNETIRYHHTDDIENLGFLSLQTNSSMVYCNNSEEYKTIPALKRNIAIYSKYDKLRQNNYFSKDFLKKFQNGEYEYHVEKMGENDYAVVEWDYQKKKLYNLRDEKRNIKTFKNPFSNQTPFIRIEAFMSADDGYEKVFMNFDKSKDLTQQPLTKIFETPFDLTDLMVKKVSVLGNGKKGGAISISMGDKSARSLAKYYIDTDFEGWRDFVLIETDNGERPDLELDSIEKNVFYILLRERFKYNKVKEGYIETEGDVSGVKISDITLTKRSFEVLKNPTVTVENTKIIFECDLKSTDFIEFDGKTAKMIDKKGNETEIPFKGKLVVPEGEFMAKLTADAQNQNPLRAQLTFGFKGKCIKE